MPAPDRGALGDGDLSTLTLQHSGEQFTTTELESLVNLQAELECLNSAVGVELDGVAGDGLQAGTMESVVTIASADAGDTNSPETILPDMTGETEVELAGVDDELNLQLASSEQISASLNIGTPTAVAKASSGSSIVVIQSPLASSAGSMGTPTHMTLSGGQIVGKIAGLTSAGGHFQALGQTLVTAKSADGNIVQLQPASASGSGILQAVRPIPTIKRPANTQGPVFAKVIITGNQHGGGGGGGISSGQQQLVLGGTGISSGQQQLVLATSSAAGSSQQPIKIITTSAGQQGQTVLGSPTKAITLAQAQQMGLLSPSKLQQILPSSPGKSIIVNRLVSSPVKSPTKITTLMPGTTVVKSPTKILPAPTSSVAQLKPTVVTATSTGNMVVTAGSSGGSTVTSTPIVTSTAKPMLSSQKVIIRQANFSGGLKQSSVQGLGQGQVIRIPATQNVMSPGNLAQIQLPGSKQQRPLSANRGAGAQVQYVRLVSAPGTSTSTVTAVATSNKPRTTVVSTAGSRMVQQVGTSTAVKMVPIAPQPGARTVAPKTGTVVSASGGTVGGMAGSTQRILIPASATVPQLQRGQTVTTLPASAVGQLTSGQALVPSGSGSGSYIMVPAHYVQQSQTQQQQQQTQQTQQQVQASPSLAPAPAAASGASGGLPTPGTAAEAAAAPVAALTRSAAPPRTTLEPNGIRPRKPCNCTKSQCLKLYCDCFANGEFCHLCNCNNCYNNLEHEEDRQRAIRSCLERNPNAFRPKIGRGIIGDERRHNKGCNCKRSGCLKNYCECYEAKIPCSNNCKCVGCRNVEEACDKKSLRDLAEAAEVRVQQQTAVKNKVSAQVQDTAFRPQPPVTVGMRQPFNLLTQEVLDATCQCLLAQVDEAQRLSASEEETERLVIEEFGRCLVQIIQCASRTERAGL